jgi:hypothetical protein
MPRMSGVEFIEKANGVVDDLLDDGLDGGS